MANKGWSRRFDEPIVLDDGTILATLRQAIEYLTLHRHQVRTFNQDRKEHHWGKRKLKRDQ